jgi:hypothetical protein
MLAVWSKPTLHTQNTVAKQPELRKQAFPKPQVWCGILGLHTHTENKTKIFGNCLTISEDDVVGYSLNIGVSSKS